MSTGQFFNNTFTYVRMTVIDFNKNVAGLFTKMLQKSEGHTLFFKKTQHYILLY